MTTIPVGGTEAVIGWQLAGATRPATCTLGLNDESFGLTLPSDVAFNVMNDLVATGSLCQASSMNTEWSLEFVQITKETDTGPIVGRYNLHTQGSSSSGSMPPNVSILVSKLTASGGRRNRGRMFLPPFSATETNVDALGTIGGASVTSLNSRLVVFLGLLDTHGLQPELYHSLAPFTPTPVTGFLAQSRVATQRRRLRR